MHPKALAALLFLLAAACADKRFLLLEKGFRCGGLSAVPLRAPFARMLYRMA